jgi:hypothetical protein
VVRGQQIPLTEPEAFTNTELVEMIGAVLNLAAVSPGNVPYPHSDWAANARAARAGTLSSGRKSNRVKIIELSAAEARPVLRAYPDLVPVGVRFAKRSGRVTEGTPDEFGALAGVTAVFRFDPLVWS